MLKSWFLLAVVSVALVACSKADQDPQVFVPRERGPNGEDYQAARLQACDASKVDLHDHILTQANFRAVFACANYDKKFEDLRPLFESEHTPKIVDILGSLTKSDNTQGIGDTLGQWLKDGSDGTSRIDRLLPVLVKVIRNQSFQDFLPVLSHILQAGQGVWNELLPGLADVVYNDEFPRNLDDVVEITKAFSEDAKDAKGDKDYATGIKDFARFLQTDVDGEKASLRFLELAQQIKDIQPDGTSIYQFAEHMLEFGAVDQYFLNSGFVRGEKMDTRLNDSPDDAAVACEGLNDSPEQRAECANRRLFLRGPNGEDAPLLQLAKLVVEMEKDHRELLPALATWFSANGARVSNSLSGYVLRFQLVKSLSMMNVGNYVQQYASRNHMDPDAAVTGDQLADLLQKAFTAPDFAAWLNTVLPNVNQASFGERNAGLLANSSIAADIASLYSAKEIPALAKVVLPDGTTSPLKKAVLKFYNKHRTEGFLVDFRGKKRSIEKHLGDIWIAVSGKVLGEDVVLNWAISLAQTFVTQLAGEFRDKGQPISEWYYNAPYSNPATTEMLVFEVKDLGLLAKFYEHQAWLRGDFANEVYGDNESDKRAFQMLIDQVPNIILYVRSGMSRSGSDLTRALAVDTNGYLVKTYVNLIVKVTESTDWLKKGIRLIEAYQATPSYKRHFKAAMSDDIGERRSYKEAQEAADRILRSLTKPQERDNYATSTLGRLIVPLSTVVSDARRAETNQFLQTAAKELLDTPDQKINDFFNKLKDSKIDGSPGERYETYKSIADVMKNKDCPELVRHLAGLFQEDAVRPALKFLADSYEDGRLTRLLLLVRRVLGFGR